MKKLNKIVLKKATIMTAPEMKHITGGYDGSCDINSDSSSCSGSCITDVATAGKCGMVYFEDWGKSLCSCID